ncbi:hypothetical protein D3C84_409540 [compost metagenome]
MQARGDFLQVGLAAVQQRPEQAGDALAQAAGAGQVLEFPFADRQQLVPGARAVLGVTQVERALLQAQLIVFGSKLHGAGEQLTVLRAVSGRGKLDLDFFHAQALPGQAAQLLGPAGQHRVDHEAVVGVVRADRIEAQPGAAGIFVQAGLAAAVGRIQRLEADQGAGRLAHGWRLGCGDAGQADLAEAAQAAHQQAEAGFAGQLNGRMPQAHVAWNRQARAGFGQSGRVKAIVIEQGLGILSKLAHGIGQAVDETDREVAEAHPLRFHSAAIQKFNRWLPGAGLACSTSRGISRMSREAPPIGQSSLPRRNSAGLLRSPSTRCRLLCG